MAMTEDWRGEHLIRAERRREKAAPAPKPAIRFSMPGTIAKADLVALAASGASQAEAARVLGFSAGGIGKAAARLGVKFGNGSIKPHTRLYIECCERGLTMPETAREMGVTLQAVHRAAKRYGLTFKPCR